MDRIVPCISAMNVCMIFGIDDIILSPYDRLCFEARPLVRQDHIEARLIQIYQNMQMIMNCDEETFYLSTNFS